MLNVINGGAHAANSIDLQEFMVVPVGADSFSEGLRIGAEVYHALKKVLGDRGLATGVGDEGGFAPDLESSEAAIDAILEAADRAGPSRADRDRARPGRERGLLGRRLPLRGPRGLERRHARLLGRDPRALPGGRLDRGRPGRGRLGRVGGAHRPSSASGVQLVGDDIFVTNPTRLQEGIDRKVGNSILVKVNQIGTLTETIEAVRLAQGAGYTAVMSHRSGETEDATIADLAVALGTGQIKTGAPARSDRVAKYNQLLRIEQELGERAVYPGRNAFPKASYAGINGG